MGLIHTRAAKARDRAQAQLAHEQARQLRGQRVAASDAAAAEAGTTQNPWRQPTLGEFFAVRRRNKQLRRTGGRHRPPQ
jgi:hypothetical protein